MINWGSLIILAFGPFFTALLTMTKLSQTTVNWILKQSGHDFFHDYYWILKQDMIRILKQWRHDFSGKHLCDGYCVDIMWYLCVDVKVQRRVIQFCKASLRISYVLCFKNYETCFLFHLKSSFLSRDIQGFGNFFPFLYILFRLERTSVHTFQTGKNKWKWNNLWCHGLNCINVQM